MGLYQIQLLTAAIVILVALARLALSWSYLCEAVAQIIAERALTASEIWTSNNQAVTITRIKTTDHPVNTSKQFNLCKREKHQQYRELAGGDYYLTILRCRGGVKRYLIKCNYSIFT